MLTQVYEISTTEEASAISAIGVDHVGVLVGDGRFPRELPVSAGSEIGAAIVPPSKFSALFLTPDVSLIASWVRELNPRIVHLGASAELLFPNDVALLKRMLPGIVVMRSIPVFGEESVAIAGSYAGIADFLLLDSYRSADKQIGALGLTHDWGIVAASSNASMFLLSLLAVSDLTNSQRRFELLAQPASIPRRERTSTHRMPKTWNAYVGSTKRLDPRSSHSVVMTHWRRATASATSQVYLRRLRS